mmetsp:Transcript_34488/g.33676  ORF Transcript_34488/g.33676 Transcript_34488/m.33676 type:complete len:83 (-) Transcript_34488:42-290(-)
MVLMIVEARPQIKDQDRAACVLDSIVHAQSRGNGNIEHISSKEIFASQLFFLSFIRIDLANVKASVESLSVHELLCCVLLGL